VIKQDILFRGFENSYSILLKEIQPWLSKQERSIVWADTFPPLPVLKTVLRVDTSEKASRRLLTPLIEDNACSTRQFSETPTSQVKNVVVGITKNDIAAFSSQPLAHIDLGVGMVKQERIQKINPGTIFFVLCLFS
jgi:hypothetical protein